MHTRDRASFDAEKVAFEKEMAAMDARTIALLAKSVQRVGETTSNVAAAKHGYVPRFVPGSDPTSETPPVYVDPATGRQWSSSNLALIAARMPGDLESTPNAAAPRKRPTAKAGLAALLLLSTTARRRVRRSLRGADLRRREGAVWEDDARLLSRSHVPLPA